MVDCNLFKWPLNYRSIEAVFCSSDWNCAVTRTAYEFLIKVMILMVSSSYIFLRIQPLYFSSTFLVSLRFTLHLVRVLEQSQGAIMFTASVDVSLSL